MLSSEPSDGDAGNGASWEELLRLFLRELLEFVQRRSEEPPRQQAIQPSVDQPFIMSNLRFFMDELRREYDLQLEIRRIIEKKANTVITMAGVVISLLFGFTIYVNSVNNPTGGEPVVGTLRLTSTEVAVIIAGVVAIVVALVLSSLSLKLGKNLAAISLSGHLVKINDQPNFGEVDQLLRVSEVVHYKNLIVHYSSNIWKNNEFNQRKSSLILLSQIALLSGIILVGISLVLVYLKYLQF